MTRIARNTGKSLEADVANAAEYYRTHKLADIRRVEPPMKWCGEARGFRPDKDKAALADFLGCMWDDDHSFRIPVAIECKSITGERKSIHLWSLFKSRRPAKGEPTEKAQAERLLEASFIWQVCIVFEVDFGRGMQTYSTTPTRLVIEANPVYDINSGPPCGYLPNGAPDILGLR